MPYFKVMMSSAEGKKSKGYMNVFQRGMNKHELEAWASWDSDTKLKPLEHIQESEWVEPDDIGNALRRA
jgi:hypothetical protein